MKAFRTRPTTISSGTVRLHAEVAGPSDGPLTILLHGFPEFWAGWANQIAPLAEAGLLVVAPDQRGYNLSDKPKQVDAYQIDRLAEDVIAIIDHFGRQKANIVGHDWGAAVAWYTAMTYPERIEKLAILNVPHMAVMNRALQQRNIRQLLKSWYIFFFQTPRLPEFLLRRSLRRTMNRNARPGTFSPQQLDRYQEAWSQPGALTGGINWYRAMARLGLQLGPEQFNKKFQKRVTVPTLVLWGDQDAFLEPQLAAESMEWVDEGRLVHFPNATHWIQHEEAEEVNRLLLEFFDVEQSS